MDNKSSDSRKLHGNVWILTITSFLTDISSEMIFNLVPLFLANVLNTGTAVIGLIDGVAETTASLMKIVSGIISDKIGKRKWLTVLGYGLSTIAKPFLYFAHTWHWVLGVRFTDRLGKGVRTAPRDALLAGSIDKKQRGLAFGLHRAGDTLGAFIGLLIAAGIIWLTQADDAVLSESTFHIIILASIVPAALAVFILAFGAREVTTKAAAPGEKLSAKGLDGNFKRFLVVMGLFTLGNSSDAFIILRSQERGLNLLQIMGMLLTFNLIYALLAQPLGALSDRIGRRKLILTGWFAYGLVYLGFALSQSGWQIWTLFSIYGIYYAATNGVAKAFIADLVKDEQRGTAYGWYNAVIGLMSLPASAIAGFLWQGAFGWSGFGPSAPFLFGAVLALLAGFLFWSLLPGEPTTRNDLGSL